jgi:hypothetical protein
MANESQAKEDRNSQKSNEKSNHLVYTLGCGSNDSDDEDKDAYAAEFVWSHKDKLSTCAS